MKIFTRKADTLESHASYDGGEGGNFDYRRVHYSLERTEPTLERALAGAGFIDLIVEARNEDAGVQQQPTPGTHAVASMVEVVPETISPEHAEAAAAVDAAFSEVDERLTAMGYAMTQGEIS